MDSPWYDEPDFRIAMTKAADEKLKISQCEPRENHQAIDENKKRTNDSQMNLPQTKHQKRAP